MREAEKERVAIIYTGGDVIDDTQALNLGGWSNSEIIYGDRKAVSFCYGRFCANE